MDSAENRLKTEHRFDFLLEIPLASGHELLESLIFYFETCPWPQRKIMRRGFTHSAQQPDSKRFGAHSCRTFRTATVPFSSTEPMP